MKKILFSSTSLFVLPLVAFAQSLAPIRTFLSSISELVAILVPLLIALGLVAFFWGLVQYIFAGAKGSAAGKKIMVWGLIALFVMVSVWGIITMAQGALGIRGSAEPTIPGVPGARLVPVGDGRD